ARSWCAFANATPLVDYLNSTEPYKNHMGKIHNFGLISGRPGAAEFARWLVFRTTRVGAEKAAQEYHDYIDAVTIPVFHVMLVPRVQVEESYSFNNGVRILPAKESPNIFFANAIEDQQFGSPIPTSQIQSILLIQSEQQKHWADCGPWPEVTTQREASFKKMRQTALLLALTLPGEDGVHPIARGVISSDEVPVMAVQFPWEWLPFKPDFGRAPVIEGSFMEADELIAAFAMLTEEYQEKLMVPLSKLNGYCSNSALIDRAIDLRTTMESLFVPPNASQVTKKLGCRTARLLGTSDSEKDQISTLMQKAYGTASDAAHRGKFKDDDKTPSETLFKAFKLTTKAIKKMIRGGQPDWGRI
ncbi:hypothetical protein KKF84_11325, partial [Myxococcota bacterium]|nr:hypothetical protein [Myxococcota bacterium]